MALKHSHVGIVVVSVLLLLGFALTGVAGAAPMTRMYGTTLGGFQAPENIAVDQSNGDVYVLDVTAQSIRRFDSSLKAKNFSALLANTLDGKGGGNCPAAPTSCDETPANHFAFEAGTDAQVTIDNSGSPLTNGDIYVTDPGDRVVDIFDSTGVYIGQLTRSGALGETFRAPCGVAVDPTGAVYVADRLQNKIHKFIPSSNPPGNSDFVTDFTSTAPCTLAAGVGPTAGALFVNRKSGAATKLDAAGAVQYQLSSATGKGVAVDPLAGDAILALGSEVAEYDASGAGSPSLLGSFGSMQATANAIGGVAVDGTRAKAYVSEPAAGKVYVYGALVPAVAPRVSLGTVTPLSGGGEGISGYVDAEDIPTTYYFEYGKDDCAAAACASSPGTQDAQVEQGIDAIRVSRTLSGLRPGTTYHYRLVASNAAGVSRSEDRTFTTLDTPRPPASACPNQAIRIAQSLPPIFPDCRAYEWVSAFAPGERNNADVLVTTTRIRTASNGSAFKFLSLTGAGDAQSVVLTTAYMGVRDPNEGWAVHGISPPQQGVPVAAVTSGAGREPRYWGQFSRDLSKGVYLSHSLLSNEGPNVDGIWNLYRREDLLRAGSGSYRLLSDAATPQSPHSAGQTQGEDTENPKLAGVSKDLSHVLFESNRDLTGDAVGLPSGPRLYMSADGVVRLVGVLPASEGGGPSVAQAGQGNHGVNTEQPISSNGSRVVFTAPPFSSSETLGKASHSQTGGRLYLRDDQGTADNADDTTIKINASEKTNGSGPGGSDPNGAKPATFWAASADLSRIFFTTTEALTNDAPTTQANVKKLYRFDLRQPSGQRLVLVSVDRNSGDGIKNEAEGVIGASEDGSRVYFLGFNQLVPGRPLTSSPRIFFWDEGEIHQVAAVNSGVETARLLGSNWSEASGIYTGAKWARVSAEGSRLVFVTEGTSDLAGYDHGSSCPTYASPHCTEVYMYSTSPEERLQCLSCPRGTIATQDADFNYRPPNTLLNNLIAADPYLNRAMSSDGRFVFFTTAEPLSPYDENDEPDVYEFDTESGFVQLLSGGQPDVESHFLDASEDGKDVFFATSESLLPADGNQNVDVYDARVDGGFEEGSPVQAVPCASLETCRPPVSFGSDDLIAPRRAGPAPEGRSGERAKKHRKRHPDARRRHRFGHHRGRGKKRAGRG